MVSLLDYALENKSVGELAKAWGVSADQTVRRLREVPFVRFHHEDTRGGSRGRPGRHFGLNLEWHFWESAGTRPLARLLSSLQTLHKLGEPFALGVPLTSAYWQPFLHPEVRLLVPPTTFSLWQRLFSGTSRNLRVVVDFLPENARVVELEGLPVLEQPFAVVDALLGFKRVKNLNLLALADWVAHQTASSDAAEAFAAERGVDRDLHYLEDHRKRRGTTLVKPGEMREAHRRATEMVRVPNARFGELLEREARV